MAKKSTVSEIAKQLGARGGKKRAANLTPEERTEGARLAAKARWKKATAK